MEGDWQTRHHFFRDNVALRAELEEVEERARRRDLLISDDELFALYDARVPPEAVSARHFDAWWKKQRHKTPDLLTFTRAELLRSEESEDHPDTWRTDDLALPLSYRFEPGAADDGVTVHVPVEVLTRLGGDGFAWQVPALREELLTALIKSLPKQLRRSFVPAPDTARTILPDVHPENGSLLTEVARELRRRSGVAVAADDFDLAKVPAHLRVTFLVEASDGTEVARGKDLAGLQDQLAAPVRQAVATAVAGDWERAGLTGWPVDLAELPRTVEQAGGGHTVRGYPAFVDTGTGVDLRVFALATEQAAVMRAGLRRLLRLTLASPVKAVERGLDMRARLTLGANPDGSLAALLEDCADAAVDALVRETVWARDDFDAVATAVGKSLAATTMDVARRVEKVLAAATEAQVAIPDRPSGAQAAAVEDIRAQLDRLLPAGFVTATGVGRLADLTRYLLAIGRRMQRLPQAPGADRERMDRVHAVEDAYDDLLRGLSPARAVGADVVDIGWQIEELRVSLWAQQLGTPRPVSEQRIYKAIAAVS